MPKACTMHRWEDYKTHAPWMLNVPKSPISPALVGKLLLCQLHAAYPVAAHIWLPCSFCSCALTWQLHSEIVWCSHQPCEPDGHALKYLLGNCIERWHGAAINHVSLIVMVLNLLLCTYLAIAFRDCVVQPSAAYAWLSCSEARKMRCGSKNTGSTLLPSCLVTARAVFQRE